MAAKLPDGTTVHIATALAAAKNVTTAANAMEAVLTSTAHGLVNGDFVLLKSGWDELNERALQVGGVATDTFRLVDIDTTNTDNFPAGSGGGTVQKITGWTDISQIVEFSTSGGEQQYIDFGFLEGDCKQQIPSTQSAMSISIKIADDPNLDGYKAAVEASDTGTQAPLKIVLKGGGQIVYGGCPSLSKTPEVIRNQLMVVTLSYAVSSPVNRYRFPVESFIVLPWFWPSENGGRSF